MTFRKTGVAPVVVLPEGEARELVAPQIGEMREGLVWDGERWIPAEEWEPTQDPQE